MTSAADQRTARRDDRRAFRFSAGLTAAYMLYDEWNDCEIIDLSSGGAAVETRQALMRNDALRLKVAHDGITAFLDARVAYSTGRRTGLVFDQSDRDGRARFEVRERIKRHGMLRFPVRVAP